MKEGCTKAAVNFLISDLLKRGLTKHKKRGTESTFNLEEDPGVDDYDESVKFWSFIVTPAVPRKVSAMRMCLLIRGLIFVHWKLTSSLHWKLISSLFVPLKILWKISNWRKWLKCSREMLENSTVEKGFWLSVHHTA